MLKKAQKSNFTEWFSPAVTPVHIGNYQIQRIVSSKVTVHSAFWSGGNFNIYTNDGITSQLYFQRSWRGGA